MNARTKELKEHMHKGKKQLAFGMVLCHISTVNP